MGLSIHGGWTALLMLLPKIVLASGDKATNLVVVADTRRVTGVMHYFADMYNTNIDGFVKSPISALRFILRHCGVR
jgi:hypothetical protein